MLIARAAPPVVKGDENDTHSEHSKPLYCYGAKPFIPFAGHLMQLAKVILKNVITFIFTLFTFFFLQNYVDN